MFSFFVAFIRFLRVLVRLLNDEQIRAGFVLLVINLAIGTIFYHNIEGWSLINSLYFCVVTLATIGFGDFVPQTTLGKIFTIIYIFIGMGLLLAILNLTATKSFPKKNE